MTESEATRPIIGIENRTPQEVFDIMSDRMRGVVDRLDVAERAVEFVATWAWRDTAISDAERLSAVRWHPTIYRAAVARNPQLALDADAQISAQEGSDVPPTDQPA